MIGLCLSSCSDDGRDDGIRENESKELPEWYYTGGELGTSYLTTANAYEQPTVAVEEAGLYQSFKNGEQLFEKPFMSNTSGVRHGLGPLYIRTSCIHCHPGYGHGKSQPDGSFNTGEIGNGYLLAVFNPADNSYVPWLAGMPQTHAVAPFKNPLDESQITIRWMEYVDGFGNRFPDGESYSLRYPEVGFPSSAVYVVNQGYQIPSDYEVRLESTIGIYGTGLLDAISDEDIKAQYAAEEAAGIPLNPAVFADGDWVGMYSNSSQGGDGTKYVKRYTYALSRGPLQDGPGANAIWNITNVTRSDRTFHYLDLNGKIYATYASRDKEVQAGFPDYIARIDPDKQHPEWWTDDMESNIFNYLTSKTLAPEMDDEDYVDLMVWHRGLAVPAARNAGDEEVARGKELFSEIGCAYCHRPTWTTGADEVRDPARFFDGQAERRLPRYPYQKIWPYTDMIQHRLCMKNDIRTGWCRTTPLWGRGLHQKITGAEYADRLHDCRARTTLEAVMWHGASSESDAYRSVVKFRELDKADREAVIKFLDSI